MKLTKNQVLTLIAVILPAGLIIAYAVKTLFFVANDDAGEGDSKLFSWLRFWKPKPVEYANDNVIMDYKIQNITSSLTKHKTKKYGVRNLNQITQAVIHHSATRMNAIGSRPQVYAKFHVENRGWPGIGYHFVIQPNGDIFQTNELKTVSNHVQNANTKSIGICLSGNFDVEQPTEAAYNAAVWLVKVLSTQLSRELEIKAHNEYAPKSCPGAAIDINIFRQRVKDLIA
jgi:N-acetyl-anhydromuramyl-L-alanine amidase AmpD